MPCKWERLTIAGTQNALSQQVGQPVENIVEKVFSLLCF